MFGATGAAGTVALAILAERGYENVHAFASGRSTGSRIAYGERSLLVKEVTAEALQRLGEARAIGFFAVSAETSRGIIPEAVAAGMTCIDKSSAFRMEAPLVVPEINGKRALEHKGIVSSPNCSTTLLVMALKGLDDAAKLRRVRVATYQSVSGAGNKAMDVLRAEAPQDHDLRMDWLFEGDRNEEEDKLRKETIKVLERPNLLVSARTVRVPVLVGHAEAVWIELEEPLTPSEATDILAQFPGVRVVDNPTPGMAAGQDEVLVGGIRTDTADPGKGLELILAGDNLRKGAALNAIQIAELLIAA